MALRLPQIIANGIGNFIDPRHEYNTQNTIAPTPGNIGKGIVKGVGGLIQGFAQLPHIIGTAVTQPDQVGPMVQSTLGGLGTSVNNMVGQPVNPQTGNLQVPSLAEFSQNMIKNPVDVATNLMMGEGAVSKLGKLGKSAKAAEEVAAGVREMKPPAISDTAAKTYMTPYTIPTGLTVRHGIDPVSTAKWMINDNPDMKNINGFLDNVEGIKRNVLGNAANGGKQIEINGAFDGGVNEINSIPQIKGNPKVVKGFQDELRAFKPTLQTTSKSYVDATGKTVNIAGGKIGGANPLDTYDAIHELEKQGYKYKDAAKDATGQVRDITNDKLGDVYINTAKELETQLDSAVGKENIHALTQDPQIIQQISQFSPKVAQRLQNNVKNWSDLRALQKPYVDMNKILNYTKDAGHTAFANLSGTGSRFLGAGLGAGLGGAIAGGPGAAAGSVIGGVAEPYLSAVGNKLLPPITAKIARATAGGSSAVGKVSGTLGLIKSSTPALIMAGQGQNQQNQQQNAQVGAASTPPTQQDRYTIPSPFDSGQLQAINDHSNKIAALEDQYGKQKITDPVGAAQTLSAIDTENSQFKDQQPLLSKWTDASDVVSVANTAVQDLQGAPINILNLYPTYDKLVAAENGKYQQLAQELKYLSDKTGTNLFQAKSKEAIVGALDGAIKTKMAEFNTIGQTYTGGNGKGSNAPPPRVQVPVSNSQSGTYTQVPGSSGMLQTPLEVP